VPFTPITANVLHRIFNPHSERLYSICVWRIPTYPYVKRLCVQAKVRLEMSLEKARQQSLKEMEDKDQEMEDLRFNTQKKVTHARWCRLGPVHTHSYVFTPWQKMQQTTAPCINDITGSTNVHCCSQLMQWRVRYWHLVIKMKFK